MLARASAFHDGLCCACGFVMILPTVPVASVTCKEIRVGKQNSTLFSSIHIIFFYKVLTNETIQLDFCSAYTCNEGP